MSLSIVIPCYNEADNVRTLMDELLPVVERLRRDREVELVFVDDGSTDGTDDLLVEAFGGIEDVRVIRHERNRGLGAALKTGFANVRGDVVVTTDSDATYPFMLIIPLLDGLRPGVDLVTASCYHPEGGVDDVPGYRVLLSKTASLMYRALLDRDVHTYTCLFRAYRREVVDAVSFESDGFLAVTEILSDAIAKGYHVSEMPCTLRSRRHGISKARIARTVLAHLGFQSRLLLRRILSTPVAPGRGRPPQVERTK